MSSLFSHGNFRDFLNGLGYSEQDLPQEDQFSLFTYSIPNSSGENTLQEIKLDYFFFENRDALFETHLAVWNKNDRRSFVAVFDDDTYIIDARQKPELNAPLSKRVVIASFDYGINSVGYDNDVLRLISKEGVDSSSYFDFVISKQQQRTASEVDKDLLLNLLALRRDLLIVRGSNETIVHLLLLRCLFVKYLEDRGVFDSGFLLNALEQQSPNKLVKAFNEVKKINGDLFTRNELTSDEIEQDYLKKLSAFFGYYNYQNRQGKLFPYQFDKIPIQLISNIYESFLNEETKKENGIYYTPSFLVNFMLSQSLAPKAVENPHATVLDPACGSGAFLVEAFKLLIQINGAKKNYDRKKQILQKQIFGIDLDPKALQIAAFSLYLALLDGEESQFIKEKIRTESPILPSLVNINLKHANALIDQVDFEVNGSKIEFDAIIANPPWGAVSAIGDENFKLREAIGNKSKTGTIEDYHSVSQFQRSQAFLLRAKKWCDKTTIVSMVVNNSIFYNEKAEEFRKDFLSRHKVTRFYELSGLNPILFKKRSIGKVRNKEIQIGANEACCVIFFEATVSTEHVVQYISPQMNKFSESLRVIAYSSRDIKEVRQTDLINEDLLWKIFVHGSWADYTIIKKRIASKDRRIAIECRSGLKPQKNMRAKGEPIFKSMIEPADFRRYVIRNKKLKKFNINQELERERKDKTIFKGNRIIFSIRPRASDGLRLRAIRLKNEVVFKHNINSVKIKLDGAYCEDYRPYLAILASKFIGYILYHISAQWGKGDEKYSTLRNSDIESLPIPRFHHSSPKIKRLSRLVEEVEQGLSQGVNVDTKESEIDNIVFDLYDLSLYERAVIQEFFDTNLYKKNAAVKPDDLKEYINSFKSVFSLVLNGESQLTDNIYISPNLGAVVSFSFAKSNEVRNTDSEINIVRLVKTIQLDRTYFSSVLAEEKVKVYHKEEKCFYIIKSNQFKDWTVRQAIDDANEEVGAIFKHLSRK